MRIDNIVPAKSQGRYVVYASSYAALDSSVVDGGGTDDTEAIQAILDKAPEWGSLHLIVDGAALVRGLHIHSNTTIECETKDCGFFLASGSNRSIVENAHLDFKIRRDRNITLLGGTYNHNCAGQEHSVMTKDTSDSASETEKIVIAMEFYGVEHLTMRDVTVRNQRTYAMLIANWYRVTMENITIELPNNMYAQNQDGIHFLGPGRFLSMRNIAGCAGDDFIALAPDENDSVSDITDVTIDGVFLDNADQGIRMLSRGEGRLDRVVVRNVMGTFKSFGFFINAWYPGSGGSFGNITLENIDLRQTEHKYDYTDPFLFRLGGNIETITLRNISHHIPHGPLNLLEIGIPFYTHNDEHVAEHSRIDVLVLDGLQIYENEDSSAVDEYIKVFCPVESMVIRATNIMKRNVGGCLMKTTKHADIGCLHISSLTASGLESVVDHQAGRINRLFANDIMCDGPVVVGNGEIGSLNEGVMR